MEAEDGAAPFHDWNERITAECYAPNTTARRVDGQNRILSIVNNFEKISFDFGPTLLSWLNRHHPETCAKIIEADRISQAAHGGHGNAIAQAYNHLIMPLATRRDKVTQVLWGIEDFRRRFGREPESMWLPETAVDAETLAVLAEAGLRLPEESSRLLVYLLDPNRLGVACAVLLQAPLRLVRPKALRLLLAQLLQASQKLFR